MLYRKSQTNIYHAKIIYKQSIQKLSQSIAAIENKYSQQQQKHSIGVTLNKITNYLTKFLLFKSRTKVQFTNIMKFKSRTKVQFNNTLKLKLKSRSKVQITNILKFESRIKVQFTNILKFKSRTKVQITNLFLKLESKIKVQFTNILKFESRKQFHYFFPTGVMIISYNNQTNNIQI